MKQAGGRIELVVVRRKPSFKMRCCDVEFAGRCPAKSAFTPALSKANSRTYPINEVQVKEECAHG